MRKNINRKLYNALCDKSIWRIPEYKDLMKRTGVTSKNSIFKALRVLQSKGKLDKDFKPIINK